MHLAGWKLTVCEGASRDGDWNILDVKIPNFNEAREVALKQYRPDSFVVDLAPSPTNSLAIPRLPASSGNGFPARDNFFRWMEPKPRPQCCKAGCRPRILATLEVYGPRVRVSPAPSRTIAISPGLADEISLAAATFSSE